MDPRDLGAVAATALTVDGHPGRSTSSAAPQSLLPADRVRVSVRRWVVSSPGAATERGRPRRDDRHHPAEYVDAFFDFSVDGALDESQVQPTVQKMSSAASRAASSSGRLRTLTPSGS